MIDAHVHFWNPQRLQYPWLQNLPALQRPFTPAEYRLDAKAVVVDKMVFVECNCLPSQNRDEVSEAIRASADIAGVVAFTDLTDPTKTRDDIALFSDDEHVKGIRHNIQGQPAGFALQRDFIDGVRLAGANGLTFDICATHDQLEEVAQLVGLCPDTTFVLDHCGKPAIRAQLIEPWRSHIDTLASYPNVWCKLSGLFTEANPGAAHNNDDLLPYAEHVLAQFGSDRLMFGSDWPVVTLAGSFADWYVFTTRLTNEWSQSERSAFYHDNATRCYQL